MEIIKNCQTCGHRVGKKYSEFDQCQKTGLYCSVARRWPQAGLDHKICKTEQESWKCPNMLPLEGDKDLECEHYLCKICRKRMKLYYDDMR